MSYRELVRDVTGVGQDDGSSCALWGRGRRSGVVTKGMVVLLYTDGSFHDHSFPSSRKN